MLFVQKQEPAKKGRKTRSKNETILLIIPSDERLYDSDIYFDR